MGVVMELLNPYYWPCSTADDNELLEDHACIVGSTMESHRLGNSTRRTRGYLNLRHRVKALPSVPPLSRFVRRFYRCCQTTWLDAFWAHTLEDANAWLGIENELEQDLQWAKSRPTAGALKGRHGVGPYEAALTDMEATHWLEYCRTNGQWEACMLGQNPKSQGMSNRSKGGRMMTLIRNMELIYTKRLAVPRWMCGSEAAQCQNYRMDPKLRTPELLGAFATAPLHVYHMKNAERTSRSMRHAAGNTMDVFVVMVALVHHWMFSVLPGKEVRLSRAGLAELEQKFDKSKMDANTSVFFRSLMEHVKVLPSP